MPDLNTENYIKAIWHAANICLQSGQFERLKELLLNNMDFITKQSADLCFLYYMSMFEMDKEYGVLHTAGEARQAVENLRELRRLLLRLNHCGEYDAGEVIDFIVSKGFTERQLGWTISAVCREEDLDYLISRLDGGPARPEEDRTEDWTPGPDNTVAFICCTNNRRDFEEMLYYLRRLHQPPGVNVELWEIHDAASMCAGYNHAMASSQAKYRVYLHQDVRILNRWFLYDLIRLFRRNPDVGLVGMVGAKEVDATGIMWRKPRYGNLLDALLDHVDDCFHNHTFLPYPDKEGVRVSLVDGLLLATQYDIPWREDLFDGWDFYDASQSMEFRRRGYGVMVPWQETPWCLHDSIANSMRTYDKYRRIFLRAYFPDG